MTVSSTFLIPILKRINATIVQQSDATIMVSYKFTIIGKQVVVILSRNYIALQLYDLLKTPSILTLNCRYNQILEYPFYYIFVRKKSF